MTTETVNPLAEWSTTIAALERRNGIVELRLDDADRPSGTARARLLQIEPNGDWLLERPFTIHGPSFSQGAKVIGVVDNGNRRLGFHAAVKQVQLFQLNREKRIPALRLTPPDRIHSAQRRAYYRVSTTGSDMPIVKLWVLSDPAAVVEAERANAARHLGENVMASEPPVGQLITGQIVDISGNGISLLIDPRHLEALSANARYWAELRLPGDPDPIRFVLKKVRCGHEAGGPVLGAFMFDFEHNPPHQRFVTNLVCRFTAAQQRAQLQRSR